MEIIDYGQRRKRRFRAKVFRPEFHFSYICRVMKWGRGLCKYVEFTLRLRETPKTLSYEIVIASDGTLFQQVRLEKSHSSTKVRKEHTLTVIVLTYTRNPTVDYNNRVAFL